MKNNTVLSYEKVASAINFGDAHVTGTKDYLKVTMLEPGTEDKIISYYLQVEDAVYEKEVKLKLVNFPSWVYPYVYQSMDAKLADALFKFSISIFTFCTGTSGMTLYNQNDDMIRLFKKIKNHEPSDAIIECIFKNESNERYIFDIGDIDEERKNIDLVLIKL